MNSNGSFPQGSQFALPIPYPIWSADRGSSSLIDNDAPARVKTALEFLSQLTIKTMPRAAINDISIEWSNPEKLTANELSAQGAACNLLIRYFSGDLKPDGWESLRKKVATSKMIPSDKPGTVMRCFGCMPDFSGDCTICDNKRTVIVYPSHN